MFTTRCVCVLNPADHRAAAAIFEVFLIASVHDHLTVADRASLPRGVSPAL